MACARAQTNHVRNHVVLLQSAWPGRSLTRPSSSLPLLDIGFYSCQTCSYNSSPVSRNPTARVPVRVIRQEAAMAAEKKAQVLQLDPPHELVFKGGACKELQLLGCALLKETWRAFF